MPKLQGATVPPSRLRTSAVFLYTLGAVGLGLLGRFHRSENVYGAGFTDTGRDLATLWFENYPGHDTSSYFSAAWSWHSTGVLADPGWQWVTNLWPPGMVMQSYAILSLLGPSAPVVLIASIFSGLLWSAAITLSMRQWVGTRAGLVAALVGIPLALQTHPMQQVLGSHVLMPTGYAVGFAILGLGTIMGSREQARDVPSNSSSRRTVRFILAGLFFGISALYRVTTYIFLFVVVAVLLLFLFFLIARRVLLPLRQLSWLRAFKVHLNQGLATSLALACTFGIIAFLNSDSRRLGVSVSVVLAMGGLLTWATHVLLRPSDSSSPTPPYSYFFVWGVGTSYAIHSLLVNVGIWSDVGARPVGPAWFGAFGAILLLTSSMSPHSVKCKASRIQASRGSEPRVASLSPERREPATAQRSHVQAAAVLAMTAGMAAGMMVVDSWTSLVTENSHPSVRAYTITVPALAHGARWRTDEDWTSIGADWLLSTSTNWPCKLQPDRCLEIQKLEEATAAPYSGDGRFSPREFRNMAISAAIGDPIGYIWERAPYFWLHWSMNSSLQGAFFLLTSLWAVLLAAFRLKGSPETFLVALLSLILLGVSTAPMLYYLFYEYYFFPLQLGSMAVILMLSRVPDRARAPQRCP